MTYEERIREWDGKFIALRRKYDDLMHDAYLNVCEGILTNEEIARIRNGLNEECDALQRELAAIEKEYGDRNVGAVEVEYGRR